MRGLSDNSDRSDSGAVAGPSSRQGRCAEVDGVVMEPSPTSEEGMGEDRMTRLEDEVREQGRILADIRTTLATLMEQMKQALASAEERRALERRIDALEVDVRANTELRARMTGLIWKIALGALGAGAAGASAATGLFGVGG